MIFELKIKDFILIEEVTIDFLQGLNIITGETGAGKSMILGALSLIMGETASKETVRIGTERALIKASFYTNDAVNDLLTYYDIPSDDEVIIISREIQAKGKSISRINGQVSPVNIIKEVSERLIDLHGQNENQKLLLKSSQLSLIDSFGGESLDQIKSQVKKSYLTIKTLKLKLADLLGDESDKSKKIDFLTFQFNEIHHAKLKIDEDIEFEKEFEYLSNIETLKQTFEKSSSWLNGDYEEGILNKISILSNDLRKIENIDEKIVDVATRMKEFYYVLEDLTHDVESYKESLEFDPERFTEIERRLDTINTLKTKYGQTIHEILDYETKVTEELYRYETIDEEIQKIKEQINLEDRHYHEISKILSEKRKVSAQSFEKNLQSELMMLNMKDTRFKVELSKLDQISENGLDDVEFTISTNVGQPFKPLKKVVSGGELSRLMLGIKIVLGHLDQIPTLIFDEIDTGISGITANVVGEKLSKLSKLSQIICVTHLPQIAVFSDQHLLIEKSSQDDKTITTINEIKHHDIVKEIGRLVGGVELTDATHTHAEEMIFKAKEKKN